MRWLLHCWTLFWPLMSAGPAALAAEAEDGPGDLPDIDDLSVW